MNNPLNDSQQLQEKLARLWLVLQAGQLGIWDWNMETDVVEVDERWLSMLGYESDDLEPFFFAKFLELCHPEDQKIVNLAVENHIKKKTSFYEFEVRIKNKANGWTWIKSTGLISARGADDKPLHMTGVHENVTEVVSNRIQGEIAKGQLEAAQRLGGLGSWYLDLVTEEITWSSELFKMHGLEAGRKPPPQSSHHQLFSPESWQLLSQALDKVRADGEPYDLELEMVNEGVFHGWMHARGEAIRSPSGEIIGVLGVAMDITNSRTKENELRSRALRDPLTQLGNRSSFQIGLTQALRKSEHLGGTFALAMVDIDHFKEINDQFGHDVGDQSLVALGERLGSTVRGDDQIFRIGGDEFIVILAESISAKKSAEIGERIVNAFRSPLLQLENPLIAQVSVGLVIWNGKETSEELVKRADEALYTAKSSGRNRLFTPEL